MLCHAVSGTDGTVAAYGPDVLLRAHAESGTDRAAGAGSTAEDKENVRYIIHGTARDAADIPPHMQVW